MKNRGCPGCISQGRDGTKDHLFVHRNGKVWLCNRCGYTEPVEGAEVQTAPVSSSISEDMILACPPRDIPSRGLSEPFMSKYGHHVMMSESTGEPHNIAYPRFIEGRQSGWKVKNLQTKRYQQVGTIKGSDLPGMEIRGGNILVIITEGEDDMVAASMMLAENGKDYRVVSLPDGAGSQLSKYSFEWLSNFKSIILAVDMDEQGDKCAERLSSMFSIGTVKRAMLPSKDANECLLNDQSKEFFNSIMSAQSVTAAAIVMGEDTWDTVLKAHENSAEGGISFPESMSGWTDKTYGIRLGELDTFTAGTGIGKTQIMRELIYHVSQVHEKRVGILSLEEPLSDTVLAQMSIAANKPLHLPDVRQYVEEEELRKYWETVTENDNLIFYDAFGSLSEDNLINKIRYLAASGCNYIFVDHLAIIVSGYAAEGDERKIVDQIMTSLKKLTVELHIWVGLVCHLRKASGTPFELGAVPTLDDLRSSGSIKQLSNQVFAVSRNQQETDDQVRNTLTMHVLKSRFTGRTGISGECSFNTNTGRLDVIEPLNISGNQS